MPSATCCRAPDLLVNTTSLGMQGQPALEIDVGRLPSQAVVADLVYVPLETPLLTTARARGLRTADGLGMLLHQAVRGLNSGSVSVRKSRRSFARWSRPILHMPEKCSVSSLQGRTRPTALPLAAE